MQDASFGPGSSNSAEFRTTQTPPVKTENKSLNNFEKHRKPSGGSNLKFIITGVVVAVAAIVVVVMAMQGNSVYYYTVAEFMDKQPALSGGEPIKVNGKVLTGSIKKDDISKTVSFTAIDRTDKSKTLTVKYSGVLPDTFKDDAEVVVTGSYGQGTFQAKEMLAKCPSKYTSEQN